MQTKELTIRGIRLGNGEPKICVPLMAGSREEMIACAQQVMEAKPDMVELRIDWFSCVGDTDAVLELLGGVRQVIGNEVLLFTFRTEKEGGEASISTEEYKALYESVCKSGYVDLVDVEVYKEEGLLEYICNIAHEHGVYVVASNHDFEKTPRKEEIVRRLRYMDEHGADIPKIAVMPKNEEDVLALLSATVTYRTEGGSKPVITMSMGGKGVVSRLAGEIFGSAVTFAAVEQTSAPGQLPINEVKDILSVIHKSQC